MSPPYIFLADQGRIKYHTTQRHRTDIAGARIEDFGFAQAQRSLPNLHTV
jgi:hypothetical protein